MTLLKYRPEPKKKTGKQPEFNCFTPFCLDGYDGISTEESGS